MYQYFTANGGGGGGGGGGGYNPWYVRTKTQYKMFTWNIPYMQSRAILIIEEQSEDISVSGSTTVIG